MEQSIDEQTPVEDTPVEPEPVIEASEPKKNKVDKIALIGLVILIVAAISVLLVFAYGTDILDNLLSENQAPVANEDVVNAYLNSPRSIAVLANDNDADNDTLAIVLVSNPTHGTAEVTNDSILYTPGVGYLGEDMFTYQINDGEKSSSVVSVSITVKEKKVEESDPIEVQYIGRYASNGTIFDSTYDDVENKTGGTPLKVFVSFNESERPPAGYTSYSSNFITGFLEGLLGMEEGEMKNVTIPPEKGYGLRRLTVGDSFNTSNLAISLNQTVEVTALNESAISLKWINMENFTNFTMPQYIIRDLQSEDQDEMVLLPPPYYIFENATEIIGITDESVSVRTTPTKTSGLTENISGVQYGTLNDTKTTFIFPDATTASWNDTTITITSDPEIGAVYVYTVDFGFGETSINFTIEEVNISHINVSVTDEETGEKTFQLVNRTLVFERDYVLPRIYTDIPMMYSSYLFADDFDREGYSTNRLAGETLIFELEVLTIHKVS